MKNILTQSITDFSRELDATIDIVTVQVVPLELEPFKKWLSDYYTAIHAALDHLAYLTNLDEESIFVDIFNNNFVAPRDPKIVDNFCSMSMQK